MNKRKRYNSGFKFKVVLEALSERYPIHELARKNGLHPTQISQWKRQFLQHGQSVFEKPLKDSKTETQEQEERLLKTIGQQKVEIDFLKKALS